MQTIYKRPLLELIENKFINNFEAKKARVKKRSKETNDQSLRKQ